tara:strand:- start:853 stop:1008 length:156 start_codon:yes stop_codon:yes gene_type:complete
MFGAIKSLLFKNKEFAETNVPLRKRAEKVFKTKEAVNKFMLAKDWTNTSRD